MSNTPMTSVAPEEAPVASVAPVEVPAEAPKKKGGYRVLAFLSLLLCVGILLLPINVFIEAWTVSAQSIALDSLSELFASDVKVFGFLPAFVDGTEIVELVANLTLYVLLLATVVAVVLSIIALITGKRCLVRTALFLIVWGAIVYSLAVFSISAQQELDEVALDYPMLGIVVGGSLFFTFTKISTVGKAAWLWLLNFLFSFAILLLAAMAIMTGIDTAETNCLIGLVVAVLLFVNAIVAFCKTKTGILRCVIQLVLAAALVVLNLVMELPAESLYLYIAAGVAVVQLILAIITRPRKEKEVVEEPDPLAEFVKEEYVEAYAYDGGPVAGVELAEEVFPTVAAIEAIKDPDGAARNTVASLLGNGFDPFLITLGEKEKNEFIDIYVLKCKGIMPEIPGYVVGGDNKDFFNKVFIYLGQYRDKIPEDLLAKMYQFSMKI